MPDLNFQIVSADTVPFGAVPLIAFKLEVVNDNAAAEVHAGVLRCQIQIDAGGRRYKPEEQARLLDLFGEPERWSTTVKPMLWTHCTVVLPQFSDRMVIDVPVPCSFDFSLAATKYFDGLQSGDLPLVFLFSGTVFYESVSERTLQVAPISWEKEARFKLPVEVWKELMDHYYPKGAWLRLRWDTFDRLSEYKRQAGIPTFDEAVERILPEGPGVMQL